MPSTTSSWVSNPRASSTVITPSLPTFSIASAIISPIVESLLAEIVPTCAISLRSLVGLDRFLSSPVIASTARLIPRFSDIGSWPAATILIPSVKIWRASTVAVVVPSPATSEVLEATSFTICAPMFSNLSSSSISLATVTPSLVTVGAPKLFSSTTLRPLGPSVTVTASVRTLIPFRILSRASCEKRTILAGIALCLSSGHRKFFVGFNAPICRSAFEHAEDIVLAQDQMLFVLELDLAACILAEKNPVAGFHVGRHQFASLGHLPLTNRYNLPLLRLFFGAIGNDDTAFGLVFFLDALHQDAIAQWPDFHGTAVASLPQSLESSVRGRGRADAAESAEAIAPARRLAYVS